MNVCDIVVSMTALLADGTTSRVQVQAGVGASVASAMRKRTTTPGTIVCTFEENVDLEVVELSSVDASGSAALLWQGGNASFVENTLTPSVTLSSFLLELSSESLVSFTSSQANKRK